MPARTKRRAKFDFRGRPFVWWIDGERYLRIISSDKKFVIAYPLGIAMTAPPMIEVIGPEFIGISPSEGRPIWLIVPPPSGKFGAWVDHLLRWSFDPNHQIARFAGPPYFL